MKLSITCVALAATLFSAAAPATAQVVRLDSSIRTLSHGDVDAVVFRRFGAYGHGIYRGGYARRGYGWRGGYAHRGYGYRGYGYRGYGYPVAAGVAGLAAGAVVGGAIASQARPAYGGNDAASYCAGRYRSYDPASGTFLGNDGLRHPCP